MRHELSCCWGAARCCGALRGVAGALQGVAGALHAATVAVGARRRRQLKSVLIPAPQEVLRDGMSDGKVVAVGETGLDYDR